jgi:hypothetical protein
MRQLFFSLTLVAVSVSCSKNYPPARAFQVQSRLDLIGGQRALGDIGDFKLSNGVIHAIVQNVGTSRGFGAFGGSLIDIDLVRDGKDDPTRGPVGNDYFTEMFPAFFLVGIEPSKVEVLHDGSDGKAAAIRVSGGSGEFISLVKSLNDSLNLVPTADLEYTCDYYLEPGAQYLKIVTTVTNNDTIDANYGAVIPFGFVTLLGEGQNLFLPNEAGFDVRYHLDEVYKRPALLQQQYGLSPSLEALPGEVVSMMATEGKGVSYAVVAAPRAAGYMGSHRPYYEPFMPGGPGTWDPGAILIPIASSSFLGTFWGRPPDDNGSPRIRAHGGAYSYAGYVAVGTGDVASVQKVAYNIKDDEWLRSPMKYGSIAGRVREKGTNVPLAGVSVVLQDDHGRYRSQARTLENGTYVAYVPPGNYHAFAVAEARSVAQTQAFVSVAAQGSAQIDVELEPSALLTVTVRDERGRPLPSKISVEAIYDWPGQPGLEPRQFLYNLKVGERFRNSDLIPDSPTDDNTRRYLETVFYATLGDAGRPMRPGRYRVYASRGNEYALASQDVELTANHTTDVQFVLEHEMDTPGWASGDFHVHSINSVDSNFGLAERVTSYAVEGIDLVTSTDHNYISDFQPTIDALKLSDWLHSEIGLELTTLEIGHFNGFPLQVDPGPVSHGSFAWFRRPPRDLFAQLRGLAVTQDQAVVQVNHPRDTVLGYFSEFHMGTYSAEPYQASAFSIDQSHLPDGGIGPYDPARFSLEFEALEVFNGKRDMLLFSYRIPKGGVAGPEPTGYQKCAPGQTADCIPPEGQLAMITVTALDGGTMQTPAFPGALDDWYSLLAHGQRITATGNSDSHAPSAEAGLPRTYLKVGPSADGSMRGLSQEACMHAMREGRAVVTNGPFIEAKLNGTAEIGDTLVAPDGEIDVGVKVQAAKWVDVSSVRIMRGGRDAVVPEMLADIPVAKSTELVRLETTRHFHVPDHSFIVIEVRGDADMWPVFTPYEVASIQISEAVTQVAGALAQSFGPAKWGKYQPPSVNTVRPFGFTNPIWVSYSDNGKLTAPKRMLPLSASEPFRPRALMDLRKLFGQFHSDP